MRRRDIDYLVIILLLLIGLYVVTTGLVMDLFGSHQFLWHHYAGYASAVLAGLHLALNWERITIYLRRRFRWPLGRDQSTRPTREPFLGRRGFLVAALATVGGFMLGQRLRPAALPNQVAANDRQGDAGQFYHHWSKPGDWLALSSMLDWGRQPARYKTYAEAERIALPDPHGGQGLRLAEAIEQRRSRREYVAEPLTLAELSPLLYAASGITAPAQGLRAAPSAGALYPLETYVVVHNVTELEPGLYHYAVADHALERLQAGDLRAKIVMAGIGQEMLGQASVCFVLSAIFQRTRWKYHERAYRYILLEAGHIGQNLYLAATSLGLGACAVGAFLDDQLNDLLGVDGEEEAALYIITAGKV